MTDSPVDRERVYDRIAPLIMEFSQRCGGETFHAEELRTFVRDRVPEIAPASPDRILRQLRLENRLGYEVINRRASLYQFNPPKPPKSKRPPKPPKSKRPPPRLE